MDSWRVKALQRMVKTYRPTLELEFLLSELSYQPSQYSEGIEFITRLGAVITTTSDGMKLLDPKVSIISSAPVIAPDDQLLL